jgi:hypothetical protein
MSTLKTNNVQLGSSATASNNFTWYQPSSPDGTVRLGNGNSGSVTEVARFNSAGAMFVNAGYGSVAQGFVCRAWVNFNGTGTVAIRASGNVSSITDNGVGNYTVNFTTAMSDTLYTFSISSRKIDNSTNVGITNSPLLDDAKSTTQFGFRRWFAASSPEDSPELAVAIFR